MFFNTQGTQHPLEWESVYTQSRLVEARESSLYYPTLCEYTAQHICKVGIPTL